jgi:hypothetical protein
MSLGLLPLSLCLAVAAAPARSDVEAAQLLHDWDVRRAQAWSSGDAAALGDLYTPRSPTGRADRSMLRSWSGRGLHVQGMRMQLIAVRVRTWSDQRVVLVVTDRLSAAVAVGPGVRVPLPRDSASTRIVTLRRVAGEWRMASVLDQARAVRTTSWTVRSRNS